MSSAQARRHDEIVVKNRINTSCNVRYYVMLIELYWSFLYVTTYMKMRIVWGMCNHSIYNRDQFGITRAQGDIRTQLKSSTSTIRIFGPSWILARAWKGYSVPIELEKEDCDVENTRWWGKQSVTIIYCKASSLRIQPPLVAPCWFPIRATRLLKNRLQAVYGWVVLAYKESKEWTWIQRSPFNKAYLNKRIAKMSVTEIPNIYQLSLNLLTSHRNPQVKWSFLLMS